MYLTKLRHVADSAFKKAIYNVFALEDAIQVECLQYQEGDSVLIDGIITRSVTLGDQGLTVGGQLEWSQWEGVRLVRDLKHQAS
jgi:hypothetical protein